MADSVGQLLRSWRQTRGLSQLDVAMHAGFSARHISFIETGRAQPSRDALLAIAESLEVPLRERNRLLSAGGFANVYKETQLAAADMAQVRHVLQFILDRHMPYGALLLDRAERELSAARDDAAAALLQEIRGYAHDIKKPPARRLQSEDLLLPVHLKKDAIELRMFSTIMTIGTPQDITLQELRIETFFPADAESESTWRALML
jgi:transcriptional regulator with XRE-family HTH domain